MKKDLISMCDLDEKDVRAILDMAGKMKKSPFMKKKAFANKTLALLFQKPSNRTRISFEVAMAHLGGYTLYLSPFEIDMGVRESVKDVACVISRYVDGVVARVFEHKSIQTFAHYSDVPVINGLSDLEHPCQALSDILTVQEKFPNLKKVTLTYVGDGNNVLNSLLLAAAMTGVRVRVATPKGYESPADILKTAGEIAARNGSSIETFNDPFAAIKGADVVYTDVWVSMGQEAEKEKRMKDFAGFQVNETLLRASGKETLIMHCLPAHRGYEITDVMDGKNSIVYDQAENRMHVEKAILWMLLSKNKKVL